MKLRSVLRKEYIRLIARFPQPVYPQLRNIMEKRHGVRFAAQCDLERFRLYGSRFIQNPKAPIRAITKGLHPYDFFNICFLNDMLSNCLRAVCDGYLPRVALLRSNGENVWEDFFEQPFPECETAGRDCITQEQIEKEAIPRWVDVFDRDKITLYATLYTSIPVFKNEVSTYIQNEVRELLAGRKVLGVLCRGTDYTMTRPSLHPIQPAADEILKKAEEVFQKNGYEYIYLATEDSAYETLFRGRFGERVLVNKRQYYDKAFSDQKLHRLKDVHFERENDLYYKGLEYVSSLIILSKCQGIVAGNCGGTQAAIFWNSARYEDMYVFDLGLYP